jgi:hypothetical protein
LGSLGLAELLVRAIDLFAEARAATRLRDPSPIAAREAQGRFRLHPFLGYAGNPGYESGLIGEQALARIFPAGPSAYYERNRRINAHGFPSEHADYTVYSDGYHVGIFGGSVAEQLATIGGETLIAELGRALPRERRPVRVLNAAIGSYKQPQQLIALLLLTLQGVRFDAIVNLDGFNEVALSSADAIARYDPLLPSRLQYLPLLDLARGAASAAVIERTAELLRTQRRADAWRAAADAGLVASSELARALFGAAALRLDARAARLEQELQEQAPTPPDLATHARACLRDPETGCWDLIGDSWETSSLRMAAIARQLGARYVHVLQPNQYDEGSKPLSERERAIAYAPEGPWPAGVRRGYPLLRARIAGMRAQGVAVHDLTRIFAGVGEDIYVDPCCHYNLRGTRALARAIADLILRTEAPR